MSGPLSAYGIREPARPAAISYVDRKLAREILREAREARQKGASEARTRARRAGL